MSASMRLRLSPRRASVGGSAITRLLPQRACRKVGPWVFLDRFGPASVERKTEHDILPHPHCGLSTVSYLFSGETEHRDSTGGHARIRPGEIHWMRGGHGIVHSERTPKELVGTTGESFGLQLWCAHADGEDEQEPRFDSWTELPSLDVEGVQVDLLAGDGWGQASPVDVTSPLVYAIAHLKAGQTLKLPDHEERCIYPVEGRVVSAGQESSEDLLIFESGSASVQALQDSRLVILGGDAIGERYIWWNLVHSDRGRLKEQAERWRRQEFPKIPGDDQEFIPGPEHGP